MTDTGEIVEIHHKSQLIEYFEQGNKPPEQWGIGTEHEKFLFHKSNLKRLDYQTEPGVKTIFRCMQKSGWQPIKEGKKIIGLKKEGASVTLEPGGQFELSGRNVKTVKETCREAKMHFEALNRICQKYDLFMLSLGVDPFSKTEDVPWIPKERYAWMRAYMPDKGSHGLEMMTHTASIQVNLDYADEPDMIKKMRVGQALQPVVSAIFSNAPFYQGTPNGFLSYRGHIWDHTDPDRCGFLPFIFEEGFGFERWVDYLLDIPIYFMVRNGTYQSAEGMTFRAFLQGKHRLRPRMEDWITHLSTVFPDVRLRQFIEMRGADAGSVAQIASLSALWVGLLYDPVSLEEANELISKWDVKTIQEVRHLVPRKGLNARSGNMHAGTVAGEIYRIARDGLNRRAIACHMESESRFLEPVREITKSGITQAEKLVHLYENNIDHHLFDLLYRWQKSQMVNCPEE